MARDPKPKAATERHEARAEQFDPALVKGIVLDANAHGYKGVLNLQLLRELGQEAADEDIEVWLPEPLLWEGVVHLFEVLTESARETKRARGLAKRVGIDVPDWEAPADVVALVDDMTHRARLVPNLTILPMAGEDAVSALKDQVLQTGPGREKTQKDSGGKTRVVRTGALDSAWLRVVQAHSHDPGSYVLISKDRKDIIKAFGSWGLPIPPIVASTQDLRQQLFRYQPGKNEAATEVLTFLRRAIGDGYLEFVLRGARLSNLRQAVRAFSDEDLPNYDSVPSLLRVKRVVGVGDLNVSRTKRRISVQVYLLADVTVSAGAWSDEEEGVVESSLRLDDSVLQVPMLIQVRDGEPADGDVDGDLHISLPTVGYGSQQPPLEMMLASMRLVPGLLDQGSIEFPEGGPWEGAFPDGRAVRLGFDWLDPVGWRVRAEVGDLHLILECKPDPLVVLVPDDKSGYEEIPTVLEVEGDSDIIGGSKEWAVSEFLLRQQFGQGGTEGLVPRG